MDVDVPEVTARAFESFRAGRYALELAEAERAFYTPARLASDERLRFRRDIPPFLGAGRLAPGRTSVVTFGINPKRRRERAPPATAEEYHRQAQEAFSGGEPSAFHRRYLDLLEGVFGPHWRASYEREYATFDMVPWYSDRWAPRAHRPAQLELIRPHIAACRERLRGVEVRLVIFNGKPWESLVRLTPPVFDEPFQERERVEYQSITGRPHHGEVLVGEIALCGPPVPALVLTRFVHQTRPPFRSSELRALGTALRPSLLGRGLRT